MEKRILSRIPFDVEAVVEKDTFQCSGKVINLSLNGMFLHSDEDLEIDAEYNVMLRLVGANITEEIHMKGKPIHRKEGGYGFQFSLIDLDSFVHLRNLISYNYGSYDKIMDEFKDFVKKNIHVEEEEKHQHE